MTQQLQSIIDTAWDNRANVSPSSASKEVADAVEHVIAELNDGKLRVATREGVGQWTVHQWIKKAVLLSFRLKDNALINGGALNFFDKVPTKFEGMTEAQIAATGVRVVPPAVARRGSFIAKGATSNQEAAELKINADGSYSFELKAPVVHSGVGEINDNKTISIGFEVVDGDGDKADSTDSAEAA